MIGKYFYKRRPLANGLAMAGSPVFLSTLAPLNQAFFMIYGWRGSFLILGGLLLNCCVAGALMRPIGPKPTTVEKGKSKGSLQEAGKYEIKKGASDANTDLIGGNPKEEKKSTFQTLNTLRPSHQACPPSQLLKNGSWLQEKKKNPFTVSNPHS